MSELTIDEKVNLITRNLVNNEKTLLTQEATAIMRKKLEEGSFKIYWGTATTGRPHIAYFVPISKLADFLRAGCEVTILFADLHAYLDNQKAPWELLEQRVKYYEFVIKAMLTSIGVSLDKLRFVKGTDYQLSREYTLDVYRMSSIVTEHDAKKAGAEVVKQVESPLLSGLLYPCLQVLDEKYLKVDAQFGGIDQRKIFTLAEKYLAKLDYKKCIHLMNPMVPGLTGDKMSSSDANSKIDLLDSAPEIKKKISKAFCEPGKVEGNGVLAFAKMVLFPIFGKLEINRKEEHGGDIAFDDYASLEAAYASQNLWPNDLKAGVIQTLNKLLQPIRDIYNADANIKSVEKLAYPPPVVEKQPKKKGGGGGGAQPKGAAAPKEPSISQVDIRVGKIVSAVKHESNDALYVEQIDLGGDAPVQVVSGLVKYVPLEEFVGSMVLVITNFKPSKFRGVLSSGMVLAASNEDHTAVELVRPPADAVVGERVTVPEFPGEPDKQIDPSNKKGNAWMSVSPDLKTSENREATYKGKLLLTSKGPCTSKTLTNARIA